MSFDGRSGTDAKRWSANALAVLIVLVAWCAAVAVRAAEYRTANFVTQAASADLARAIGDRAEQCRKSLAEAWIGQQLPSWARPCPITAKVGDNLGAGGATSFTFDRGEVYGWSMTIQGSLVRILDSVVPHEVMHTIFASHFRAPLPRWADEGACTTIEAASERGRYRDDLVKYLRTNRGIPFDAMLAMREYPADVLPLYAQGYSAAEFLIHHAGRREFIDFLESGLAAGNWRQALADSYGLDSPLAFQESWISWVRAGSPRPDQAEQTSRPIVRTVGFAPDQQPPAGRIRRRWTGRQWQPMGFGASAQPSGNCSGGKCSPGATGPAPNTGMAGPFAPVPVKPRQVAAPAAPPPPAIDLSPYALKTDLAAMEQRLAGQLPGPVDLSNVALKSDIPQLPDLSNLATNDAVGQQIQNVLGQVAGNKQLVDRLASDFAALPNQVQQAQANGVQGGVQLAAEAVKGILQERVTEAGGPIPYGIMALGALGIGTPMGLGFLLAGRSVAKSLRNVSAPGGGQASAQPFPGAGAIGGGGS